MATITVLAAISAAPKAGEHAPGVERASRQWNGGT